MTTLRKVDNWEYIKDDFMNVTAFINETIGFVSNWNTGYEAEEEEELISLMNDEEFLEYAVNLIPLPF